MRLTSKLSSAFNIINYSITKKRVPVAVRLNITYRCPQRCLYCNVWKYKGYEMDSAEVMKIIEGLKNLGTKRLSISGGEPLLREDLRDIIRYCNKNNISVGVNTTGFKFDENISKVRDADLIKFSLDGDKEGHDPVRGAKTFEATMQAVRLAHKNNLNFSFASTMTKYSISKKSIDFMLNLAKKYDTVVAFQPLKKMYKGSINMPSISPDRDSFGKAIKYIRDMKVSRRYGKHIRNSIRDIESISDWPNYKKRNCYAGDLFFIIHPDGSIVSCDRTENAEKILDAKKEGIMDAYKKLKRPPGCEGCGFCGAWEINDLAEFRLDRLPGLKNIIR